MFVRRWPPLPLLHRYPPNLNYRGKTYGDLSAIIGKHSFAEDREEIFKTDSLGFRNGEEARKGPIDILLISDSFGAGIGTSQNKILSSVLRDKYDRATYNLSMPGSPWEGMKNLAIESSNISIRENAMVLWTFFMANDMDDLDLISDLEAQPQYSNIMGRALVSFSVFRNRSVIRQLLRSWVDRETSREFQKKVVGKDFLNGKKMLFWEHYAQKRKLGVDYWIGHPSYRKLVATFDQMKHLADLKGLKVVVLALPSKEEVYSWVLDGGPPWSSDVTPSASSLVLEKLSSLFGFTFFDAKAGLILESKKIFEASGSVLWWYDDTHWNEQGHAVIADIIDKEILWSLKGEFQ